VVFALAIGCAGKAHGPGSEGDSGPDGVVDARVPDGFPANCVPFSPLRLPDASPDTCLVSAADLVCQTNEDCEPYFRRGCAICGVFSVIGLNKSNTVQCPAPPCAPPSQPVPPCVDSGFTTQSCQFVASYTDIAVACVNQQCMTYAASAGSE
jgi:hypothetical protein